MARTMCANVMMEEGYMRMSVEFDNANDRDKIEAAIAKSEKEMQLFPSVLRRNISEDVGNFSVEFAVEANPRDAGAFFNAVMKDCGIDKCEA
jgi:hypothetical protein